MFIYIASVALICITDVAVNGKSSKCKWAPDCTCEHVESVDKDVQCVYYSMYISGHDLATCPDQREFPKFSSTTDKNDYTEVSGNFNRIPAKAFTLPQYSSGACVRISTKSESLLIEPFAFQNASGMFVFADIKNLTISPNVLTASKSADFSPRYGTYQGSIHMYDIKDIYLPKTVVSQHLAANQASDVTEVRLHVANSRLANLDGTRFGFDDVNDIAMEYVEVDNFREITDLFKITPTKRVKKVWIKSVWSKRRFTFQIVFENVILSNANNERSVDLGIPVDRVKSISFEEDKSIDGDFKDLSIFSGLKIFTCSKCRLQRIPTEIRLLMKLEDLNLSGNRVTSILENSLPSSLKHLNLGDNEIRSIDKKAFEKLTNLKSVILSHNPIGMKYFDVVNELGRISSHLTDFSCAQCEFTEIPNLITANKILETLSMDGNRIRQIRLVDFRGIRTLNRVHLSSNLIDTIEKGVFENSYIYELNLANNSFVDFDMANISFRINETLTGNERHTIALENNKRLRKVFTSKIVPKNSTCPFLSLSSPNLEEVDENIYANCQRDSWAIALVFRNSKKFDCEKNLKWLASESFEQNEKNCDKFLQSSGWGRVDYSNTKCKTTGKELRDYLWAKYISQYPECSKKG